MHAMAYGIDMAEGKEPDGDIVQAKGYSSGIENGIGNGHKIEELSFVSWQGGALQRVPLRGS